MKPKSFHILITKEENWFGKPPNLKGATRRREGFPSLCPCHQWLPAITEVPKKSGVKPGLGSKLVTGLGESRAVCRGKKGGAFATEWKRRRATGPVPVSGHFQQGYSPPGTGGPASPPSPSVTAHKSPQHLAGPYLCLLPPLRLPVCISWLLFPLIKNCRLNSWLSILVIQVPAHTSSRESLPWLLNWEAIYTLPKLPSHHPIYIPQTSSQLKVCVCVYLPVHSCMPSLSRKLHEDHSNTVNPAQCRPALHRAGRLAVVIRGEYRDELFTKAFFHPLESCLCEILPKSFTFKGY